MRIKVFIIVTLKKQYICDAYRTCLCQKKNNYVNFVPVPPVGTIRVQYVRKSQSRAEIKKVIQIKHLARIVGAGAAPIGAFLASGGSDSATLGGRVCYSHAGWRQIAPG